MPEIKAGFQIGSSLASKHLIDAQYIKGSYIVVSTAAERDALPVATNESDGVVVDGSLVYVDELKKLYLYDSSLASPWKELEIGGGGSSEYLYLDPLDNKVYIKSEEDEPVELNTLLGLISRTSDLESDVSDLSETVNNEINRSTAADEELSEQIEELTDQLSSESARSIAVDEELLEQVANEIVRSIAVDEDLSLRIEDIEDKNLDARVTTLENSSRSGLNIVELEYPVIPSPSSEVTVQLTQTELTALATADLVKASTGLYLMKASETTDSQGNLTHLQFNCLNVSDAYVIAYRVDIDFDLGTATWVFHNLQIVAGS